jgi:hypothetical protein
MAGTGFDVTPSELHSAATTLRSVRSELSAGADLDSAAGGGDVGYPDLAEAISDFCSTGRATAIALAQAVELAGDKVDRAGSDYERAETANAAATGR